MPKKKQSFEAEMLRLAEIVEQMEGMDVSLDTAILLYKEGLTLANSCGKMLTQYQEEIALLQQDADGNFELVAQEL